MEKCLLHFQLQQESFQWCIDLNETTTTTTTTKTFKSTYHAVDIINPYSPHML